MHRMNLIHCVDQNGTVVKTNPIGDPFLDVGIFALIGMIRFRNSGICTRSTSRCINRRFKADRNQISQSIWNLNKFITILYIYFNVKAFHSLYDEFTNRKEVPNREPT